MTEKHDSDEPKTYPVSAGAGLAIESVQPVGRSVSTPYSVLQTVGRSVSLPYDILESVAAGLALPQEVVQAAANELAVRPVEELEEINGILEQAIADAAHGANYVAELARRVGSAPAAQALVRALDMVGRFLVLKELIEYLIHLAQHHP